MEIQEADNNISMKYRDRTSSSCYYHGRDYMAVMAITQLLHAIRIFPQPRLVHENITQLINEYMLNQPSLMRINFPYGNEQKVISKNYRSHEGI
jgi:hypothetical protein